MTFKLFKVHYKWVFPFLVLFLFTSCERQKKISNSLSDHEIETINIPEKREKIPQFDEFIKNIDIIGLESKEASLFNNIDQLIYHKDKFYIHDLALQEVFVFNTSGDFLFKLNKRGRGPEEYLELRDFEVDEEGNIHILSHNHIMIFGKEGSFLKKIPFSLPRNYHINPTQFALTDKGGYYLWSGSLGIKEDISGQYAIYKIDRLGKFTGNAYFPVRHQILSGPRFSTTGIDYDYTMLPITGCDTVYRFLSDKVHPAYYLNFGKRKLPSYYLSEFSNGIKLNDAFQNTQYVTGIVGLTETPTHLFFLEKSAKSLWVNIYSKGTQKIVSFDGLANQMYFPIIKGGMGDNTFIGIIDTFKLIESKNNGDMKRFFGFLKNYKELESKINTLKINDNQTILILRINENF